MCIMRELRGPNNRLRSSQPDGADERRRSMEPDNNTLFELDSNVSRACSVLKTSLGRTDRHIHNVTP